MATSRLCSIEDCGKPHFGKSFCSKHYRRFHNHGDPLLLKIRERGKAMRFYQEVVLAHESEECLIWPFSLTEGGYGSMKTDGSSTVVSRKLCEEIYGPQPSDAHQAAHSCGRGKQGCVAKAHISWKTKRENEADKISHGTHNRGERHPLAKLTEQQAREILLLKGVEQQKEIAKLFGVSAATVSSIHRGDRWSWL